MQAAAMPATATAVKFGGSNRIKINNIDGPEIDRRKTKVYGGFRPIHNIDDPEIQRLGEWAVSEHVKRANGGLKFVKVVSGEEQPVNGMNYSLVVQAVNGNGENVTYKARVYQQWWPTTHKLVSFVPAN